MHLPASGCPQTRSLFHAPTRYALLALVRMPDDGTYSLARALAGDLSLPGPFLAKILQTLGHAGILESQRGPTGGFRLARDADHIMLREIVLAMEGPEPFEECLLGHTGGPESCHCPLRPTWDLLRTLMTTVLDQTSLRDLRLAQDRASQPEDLERPEAAPI